MHIIANHPPQETLEELKTFFRGRVCTPDAIDASRMGDKVLVRCSSAEDFTGTQRRGLECFLGYLLDNGEAINEHELVFHELKCKRCDAGDVAVMRSNGEPICMDCVGAE